MTEASTADSDVAVENNALSNHSLCDCDTLILKLTMPGGLPTIFTCCPA